MLTSGSGIVSVQPLITILIFIIDIIIFQDNLGTSEDKSLSEDFFSKIYRVKIIIEFILSKYIEATKALTTWVM